VALIGQPAERAWKLIDVELPRVLVNLADALHGNAAA